jgi:spore coat protein U-like protein
MIFKNFMKFKYLLVWTFVIFKFDNFSSDTSTKTVGEIRVICSNMTGDVNYSLALTNTNLSLNNGKGGLLSYKLFTTGNYTSLWTETNLITGTVRNVGGNGVDVKPIYGEVILLNKQRMTAGDYTNQSNPPLVKLLY